MWEFGWDCFVNTLLTLRTILWTIGGPLSLHCNGPTSWQCSQAYMFDSVHVHVIISFWDCSASRFCPKYWAVPHRSAGAQHQHTHRFWITKAGNTQPPTHTLLKQPTLYSSSSEATQHTHRFWITKAGNTQPPHIHC